MKRTLSKIVKLANKLDLNGLYEDADRMTKLARKVVLAMNYTMVDELEKDPLFIRYKMEYKKDPNFVDEEMKQKCEDKISAILLPYIQEEEAKEIFEGFIRSDLSLSKISENYIEGFHNDDFIIDATTPDEPDVLGIV